MRIPLVCVVSAALLLTTSCSRDKAPAAATPATTATAAAPAAPTPASAPAARPKEVIFTAPELMQMVAPIALYPDALVAQVLMAATYPGDVADAAAWSKAHPDAKGDDAVKQVGSQPWDPSVQSLAAFPQVLAAMGAQGPWVQRLGDAFLAQPDDVMDAIQQLRHKAKANGTLDSNKYQKVSSQPVAASAQAAPVAAAAPAGDAMGGYETAPAPVMSDNIVIESSDPQTVYVPSYDPNTAYGAWDYPAYPPTYYPPPANYYPMGGALATGMMFGVGLAVADSLWGGMNWNNNDINVNVNRYNNINSNRQINANQNTWNHNAANRDGVPYRDQYDRQNNSQRLDGADRRAEYRGEDAQRTQSREQARASMEKRGVDSPARTNQEARNRAQAATNDRAQAASRDQARDRAQAQTRDRAQADRAQTAGRDQARDRAQASAQRPQSRDGAQNRSQAPPRHKQSQSNTQAHSAARQQQTRQSPSDNAFAGASRPQESRASAQRGQASDASARRSSSSRSSGQQAQRQSSQRQSSQRQAPQRQSGGQRQAGGRR
ncbi:DUF3300 domain-containing protein [Lysobacter sp. HA35]